MPEGAVNVSVALVAVAVQVMPVGAAGVVVALASVTVLPLPPVDTARSSTTYAVLPESPLIVTGLVVSVAVVQVDPELVEYS